MSVAAGAFRTFCKIEMVVIWQPQLAGLTSSYLAYSESLTVHFPIGSVYLGPRAVLRHLSPHRGLAFLFLFCNIDPHAFFFIHNNN